MHIRFAIYDDFATRFTDSEAWEFISGQWKELNLADAHHKAKLMSEGDFKSVFLHLPPLPRKGSCRACGGWCDGRDALAWRVTGSFTPSQPFRSRAIERTTRHYKAIAFF